MRRTIYYVVEQKGWVQEKRACYLKKFQKKFTLKVLTPRQFRLLWMLGLMRRKYIYFSTWRTVHYMIKNHGQIFGDNDFNYFMAAVTSHSNIGGGLDPLNPIPGRTPEEAFRLATALLKKFKLVTVNSLILKELIGPMLKNLCYCPNGVDTEFFSPRKDIHPLPKKIRIGWLGKERGPKNFEVIHKAFTYLRNTGGFETNIIKVPKTFRKAPLTAEQVRNFYWNIDYYLCASWNEGTPNPALEAGACGIPVVTTRVGNMPELINPDENGYFINPTVDSIIETGKRLKNLSTEKYVLMQSNMRDAILRDWTWQKRIENFVEAFDRFVFT